MSQHQQFCAIVCDEIVAEGHKIIKLQKKNQFSYLVLGFDQIVAGQSAKSHLTLHGNGVDNTSYVIWYICKYWKV